MRTQQRGPCTPNKTAEISYAEFGKIPKPRAPGDAGRFVLGKIDNRRIIFAQGRVHLYEAFSAREITALIRVLARVGVKQLIITMPLARSSRNSSGANG